MVYRPSAFALVTNSWNIPWRGFPSLYDALFNPNHTDLESLWFQKNTSMMYFEAQFMHKKFAIILKLASFEH
jgi:hypothetical protein